jgi:hypothetical protein
MYLVLFSKCKKCFTNLFQQFSQQIKNLYVRNLYLRFFHNLEIFKFCLTNGPNCDTRYVVSNARKVAMTPEMWCRPDCLLHWFYSRYLSNKSEYMILVICNLLFVKSFKINQIHHLPIVFKIYHFLLFRYA